MLKLTQPHLFMNNMFPPINAHSRPLSEDPHGVSGGGPTDIHSATKQHQLRRQHQPIDAQRRSPLRIIYRSNDYAWNEHPGNTTASSQALRAGSPMKSKLTTSARHLANGILHEGPMNTMLHLPTSSSPSVHPHYARDDVNNGDLNLSSANKSRHTPRLQRTSSHFDKPPSTNGYGLPLRSESYRSSRLDYGTRPRNTSSKQRTHVNSKTSFHDINGGEFYLSSVAQDENAHFLQPPPPPSQPAMNMMGSTQRLNGSTLDITSSRKPLSPSKSHTFNVSSNGATHHTYHTSNQELHRSETNIDRNNMTRFAARGTTSKEQLIATSKYRQTSSMPAARITPTTTSNTPAIHPAGDRHPSAQSYPSRDPNMSYAYTDVKKYIEENELMSPEKEHIIRSWIVEVDKYHHQWQKVE